MAFGTTAPLGSDTTPVSVPEVAWATAVPGVVNCSPTTVIKNRRRLNLDKRCDIRTTFTSRYMSGSVGNENGL